MTTTAHVSVIYDWGDFMKQREFLDTCDNYISECENIDKKWISVKDSVPTSCVPLCAVLTNMGVELGRFLYAHESLSSPYPHTKNDGEWITLKKNQDNGKWEPFDSPGKEITHYFELPEIENIKQSQP